MVATKEWRKGCLKPVEKLFECPCGGKKEVKLPCGHRLCGRCVLAAQTRMFQNGVTVVVRGQQMRRSCPKCGHLGKNATSFWPLGPHDDPRSSVGYPDSVSGVTTTSASTANPRAFAPYKWICRPHDDAEPFTEDTEGMKESLWAPSPPETASDLPVTRYWAFFPWHQNQVIASVCGFPVLNGDPFWVQRESLQ